MLLNPLCHPKLRLPIERWCTEGCVFSCGHEWKLYYKPRKPHHLMRESWVRWFIHREDGTLVKRGKVLVKPAHRVQSGYDMQGTYYRSQNLSGSLDVSGNVSENISENMRASRGR